MRGFIITESEKNSIRNLYKNRGLIKEQKEPTPTKTDCITVEVVGRFGVMVTENPKDVEVFMQTFNAEIAKNEELKKAYDKGDLYVGKINLMGGASNVYGGKTVKPTMDNKYQPQTYPDNAKYKGDFDANMKLAEDRAKNLWTALQTKFPENKITLNPEIQPTYEKYIIDTFGKNDTTNDAAIKAGTTNPGQIVKVTVDLCGIGGGTDILKCFESAVIEVSYDSSSADQGHVCDNAVYEIYANGVPLISINKHNYASLNNKTKPNQYPSDKTEGSNKRGGAYQFNYFKLDIDGDNKQFFNSENIYKYDGGLVVSAMCKKTEYGRWSNESDCHRWVGDIKLQTTSGVEVVNVGKSDLPNTGLQFSTPNKFDTVANVAGFEACKKTK